MATSTDSALQKPERVTRCICMGFECKPSSWQPAQALLPGVHRMDVTARPAAGGRAATAQPACTRRFSSGAM